MFAQGRNHIIYLRRIDAEEQADVATAQPPPNGIDSGGGGGSYIDSNATSVATSDGQFDLSSTFNGVSITSLGFYNNTAGYISIVKL